MGFDSCWRNQTPSDGMSAGVFVLGDLGSFGTFGKGGGLGNLPVLRGGYREYLYFGKYAKYREYAPGGSVKGEFSAGCVTGARCWRSGPHLPVVVHPHPAVLSSPARGGCKVTPCLPGQRRYNTVREYLSFLRTST